MRKTRVNKVNQGTYFHLKDDDKSPLWIRGDYIRQVRKYSCFKYDDVNHEKLMKGGQVIYLD